MHVKRQKEEIKAVAKSHSKMWKRNVEKIEVGLSGPWKATIDKQIVIFHTLTIIGVFFGWTDILPIDRSL